MHSIHGAPSQNREEPDAPFGEDITNPDSRTMPPEFHGEWNDAVSEDGADGSHPRQIIGSTHIVVDNHAERVVAVRFIDQEQVPNVEHPVAVVTLPADSDEKRYSLFYFGLSPDGNSLFDLENMDYVLRRSK